MGNLPNNPALIYYVKKDTMHIRLEEEVYVNSFWIHRVCHTVYNDLLYTGDFTTVQTKLSSAQVFRAPVQILQENGCACKERYSRLISRGGVTWLAT